MVLVAPDVEVPLQGQEGERGVERRSEILRVDLGVVEVELGQHRSIGYFEGGEVF